jgi:tRNA modification GTPase
LLKESRAIVTPIAGTTRDYLEESISIGGILFRLIDTAGIRPSDDVIEVEGIDRSWRSVKVADLILLLVDASMPVNPDDLSPFLTRLERFQQIILVLNKSDIAKVQPEEFFEPEVFRKAPAVLISARTGEGIAALEQRMLDAVAGRRGEVAEGGTLTNSRHLDAIIRGRFSLSNALKALKEGATGDLVAFDIRESLSALGEITGEVTSDEVLNNIFANFCIGK